MDNEVKQRNRRRKRAQRMQAQRANKVKEGDSAEDESPDREKPIRPPNRRKKSKEPLVEEDIIDGFAILGFRTYEDLENVIALAAGGGKPVTKTKTKEVSGGRTTVPTPLDDKPKLPSHHHHHHHHNTHHHITSNLHPPSHGLLLTHAADAGTSDDSGRASERLTGSSVAPRDPDSSRDRLSDASSRCSSGKGYICDSEGEDDKGSDAGSVLFASTPSSGQRKHEFPPSSGIPSGVPGGGGASPLPDAPTSPCMAPPAPSPAPAALPPQPPVLATHMVPAEVPPPTSAVKSCGPPSIASLLNTHSAQMQASHHHHSLTTQIPQANHPPPINQTQPTSVPNHISTNLSATNHISTSLSSANHMSAGLTANNHISVSNHISTSLSVTSHSHIATSLSSSHLSMPQNGHLVGPGHATTLSNIHNSGNPSTLSYPNAQPSNHHPPVSRAPSPPPPLSAATPPASLPAALPQSASAPHEASPISTAATTPGSYLNGIVSTSGTVPLPPTNGYAPTQPMAFPAYPPLYAPYATSLRNSSAVPMSSHRSPATTLTTLSTVTQPVTTATTTTPVSQVQPMPQSTASSHRDAIAGVVANSRPTHSPRGHSPTRERDSYSSNVSSLSRGSVTPVSLPYSSGSVAASTALSSSYSKAASWSTATVGATRMSPAAPPPRPTPPPASSMHSSYPPPQAAPAQAPPPMFAPPPPVSTASPLALQSNPNPFSADSLFQSNQTDMLRRELDSRFLASHAPSYLRTEMHQHQHHHTHVHQHAAPILPPPAAPPAVVPPPALFPPPLFKDIPKMGSIDSPFYRQNLGLPSYPSYSTGLLHPGLGGPTPFVPPNHLPAFQPKQPLGEPTKPKILKSGRWNAMHVRIAWEIYHHQQKQQAELKPGSVKPDLLRPPSHMFPPGGLVHPARPHELPFHRAAQFETAPHPSSLFTAPPSHLAGISPFGRYSTFPNPGSPFGLSPFSAARDMPPMGSLHDPWRSVTALQRSVANYPPTAGPWGLKPDPVALERREQEERERERIRRERERERERKQQLEQQERERERDRREKERREHERRELDRLHQQRLAAETKVRERSPLRNGTSDDIRVKEEPRIKEEDVLGKATDPRYHPYMRHPSGLVPPAPTRNNAQLSGPPSLPTHFPPPPTPAWPPPSSADPFRDPYRFETLRYNPIMEAAMRAEEERAKMFGPYSNPHLRPTSKDMLHMRPTVPPSHLAPPPPTKEDSSTSR